MAAKLKLVSKNPILRSAFRTVVFSFLIFFSVYASSFWAGLVFIFTLGLWYFRPPINIGRFSWEVILLLASVFLLPRSIDSNALFVFALALGLLLALLLELKNVAIIRRDTGKYVLRIGIITIYNYFFFYNFLGMASILILFGVSALMLNNLYTDSTDRGKAPLTALLLSFIILELNWALALVPDQIFIKLFVSTTALAILSQGALKHFNKSLDQKAIRQSAVFLSLALLLLLIFMI